MLAGLSLNIATSTKVKPMRSFWRVEASVCRMTISGPEVDSGTRRLCGLGTTCNQCLLLAFEGLLRLAVPNRAGGDGAVCGAGTTCNACCNGYEWWDSKIFPHRMLQRSSGTVFGSGTACDNCCGGKDCPCPGISLVSARARVVEKEIYYI